MGRVIRFFMLALWVVFPAHGERMDVHQLYGAPQMYGEYEPAMPTRATLMKLYGTPPDMVRVRPIAAPSSVATPAAKHPVKPKSAAPTRAKKKSAPVKKSVPPAPTPAVASRGPVPTPAPADNAPMHAVVVVVDVPSENPNVSAPARSVRPRIPVGPKYARGIARHVRNAVDVDMFCERIGPRPRGPLPDGLVLMPGRPDLMCCVQ